MGKVFTDITKAFGHTPLVQLNRITDGAPATVLGKLEFYNPSASVKDRLGIAIVDAAEASGVLKPGGTIVEGTSGNTGIALAMVGAARGYQVILAMPQTMSKKPRTPHRTYTTHPLLRTDAAQLAPPPGPEGMRVAVARAEQIAAETPGAVLAKQFANQANVEIHRKTTAEEIWEDTNGGVDIFVTGIGTGGTISGVGQVLKERKPGVTIVGVEPAESPILNGGAPGPHKIQGIGANFVPDILDRTAYDDIFNVNIDQAVATARRLGTEEGILGGISSGATVTAAVQVAQRPENKGKTIVVILADYGERYLSTVLYEGLLD